MVDLATQRRNIVRELKYSLSQSAHFSCIPIYSCSQWLITSQIPYKLPQKTSYYINNKLTAKSIDAYFQKVSKHIQTVIKNTFGVPCTIANYCPTTPAKPLGIVKLDSKGRAERVLTAEEINQERHHYKGHTLKQFDNLMAFNRQVLPFFEFVPGKKGELKCWKPIKYSAINVGIQMILLMHKAGCA